MYILPRKCLYIFEAVLYIALNSKARAVSLKEVCGAVGVKVRYLEQAMQQLVHSGVLRGVRGPKGGYLLAKERRKLSLMEIFDVMDTYSLDLSDDPAWSKMAEEAIRPMADEIKQKVRQELMQITIEDLCAKIEMSQKSAAKIKTSAKTSDFTI